MKYKVKSLKSAIALVAVIVVAILATNFFGIGTQRSAVRVGFVNKGGWRSWSASYTLLDGWLEHTIRPESDLLHVEVETESGTISIEMKDADGGIVFSEGNIETSSFEVQVPQKVVIRVDADHHKGGFSIE